MTRKPQERIIVGDNTVITIIGIHQGQVRVGIDAPKDVPILREEVKTRTLVGESH